MFVATYDVSSFICFRSLVSVELGPYEIIEGEH